MKKLIIAAVISVSLLIVGGIVFVNYIAHVPYLLLMVVSAPLLAEEEQRKSDLLAKIEAGDKKALVEYVGYISGRQEAEQLLRKYAAADAPEVQALLAEHILNNGCRAKDGASSCAEAIALFEPLALERCDLAGVNLPISLAEAYRQMDIEKKYLWFGVAMEHCKASYAKGHGSIDRVMSMYDSGSNNGEPMFRLWAYQSGFYDARFAAIKTKYEASRTDPSSSSVPIHNVEHAQIARNNAANLELDENLVARLKVLKQRVIESQIKPKQ
jgi:hypothetical protein